MDAEKEISETLKTYQQAAAQNKNVDLAALAKIALQQGQGNTLSPRLKKWAYLISIAAPPLGLLFAVKFYLSDESDARAAGHVCVALTLMAIAIFWLTLKLFFSSAGVSLEQIQQIKPADIQQLLQ